MSQRMGISPLSLKTTYHELDNFKSDFLSQVIIVEVELI